MEVGFLLKTDNEWRLFMSKEDCLSFVMPLIRTDTVGSIHYPSIHLFL